MDTKPNKRPGHALKPHRPSVPRALGYVRVSSETQVEQGYSIGMQVEAIEGWCRQTFGDNPYELEIIRDEGLSGKLGWEPPARGPRKHRPGLAQVVQKLRAREVDYLVVYRLDRLFRNHVNQLQFCAEFFGDGSTVQLVSLTEHVDLQSLAGRLSTNVLAAVAEFQRGQICQIVSHSLANRRKDGYPTGQLGYGWRRTPRAEGKRAGLEPVPEQLVWVKKAYELSLAGWGVRKIAREFERLGAPPPGKVGGWSDQKVWRMLHQPIHAGLIWDKGETRRGVHWEHRVVEPEQWHKVQEDLQTRKSDIAHYPDKDLQPLWRVARCGTCGGRLTVADLGDMPVYRCVGSAARGVLSPSLAEEADMEKEGREKSVQPWSSEWCPGWQKAANQVDQEVVRLLARAVSLPEFTRLAEREAQAILLHEGREALIQQRNQAIEALQRLHERERKLVGLHLSGRISETIYDEQHTAIRKDREQTERDLAALDARLGQENGELALLEQVRERLPDLQRIWSVLEPEERRSLVQELTQYVVLERTGFRSACLRLKVHFLPEQRVVLHHSKSRAAGYAVGVNGLTARELALLYLVSQGKSLLEVAAHWHSCPSAVYIHRRHILERLGVQSLEEALELAAERIERERAHLPIDAPAKRGRGDWRTSQKQRMRQVLTGYTRGLNRQQIAHELGLSIQTIRNMEWKARRRCGNLPLANTIQRFQSEPDLFAE